ncbi:MAG: tRNA epoxyqueuosine(34) reductase QueG [Candidatus Gracilibacteria bacterium]
MESIFSIIEALARTCGFPLVRVTSAMLNPKAFSRYDEWIKEGKMGEMTYMARDPLRRQSVKEILPEAKSVICLAVPYGHTHNEELPQNAGKVAQYAYGRDYHKVIEKMLKNLTRMLAEKFPEAVFKSYVDTGAVLERAYAAEAGIGFIGKNTMLITDEFGSWVFLSEILTTLEIPREKSAVERRENLDQETCGYCRLCHDVCPTGALSEKGLDARRCISYLTIEYRGSIPIELRPLIGDRLFGCDACQEICPKNNKKNSGGKYGVLLAQKSLRSFALLEEILSLRTEEEFNQRFQGSAVRRAKREGLVRNACVVAANIKAKSLLPLLEKVAKEEVSEIVREHAEWAVRQLVGPKGNGLNKP